MNKAYSRINFQNAPSTATPLNATNLNKMDKAINDLDDRIIELSGYQEEAEESAEMASASASAAAKAAETATADAEARVNAIIEGLEVYTKEESDKKFAPVIKQVATGSPILIKDSSDAEAIDFKGKGRTTQNGTPTPDSPIDMNSVADGGWFDGELLSGMYKGADGTYINNANYVCSKNMIPCAENDVIKLIYGKSVIQLVLLFYDENKNYIDFATLGSAKELSATAPINAKYFHLDIHDSNLTLQTAKPITVTINDKYALIVKNYNKNIFDYSRIQTLSANGATLTNNDDGSFTVSGSGILSNAFNVYFDYSHEETVRLLKVGEIKLDINGVATTPYLYIQLRSGSSAYLQISSNDAVKTKTVTQAMLDDENVYLRVGFYGASTGVSIVAGTMKPMLYQYGDDTYEPYKETVSYIPLNEPLRSSLDGSVTDVARLNEVNRRFTEVVFDGSSDEQWLQSTNCFYINLSNANIDTSGYCKALCTHFKNHNVWLDIDGSKVDNSFTIYRYKDWVNARLAFYTSKIKTGAEWIEWLKANPIKVIYELAEPVVEEIEPVDIVTYDNVTYLTASDNADMEVTYATDTKSYIDSKFAELHAALVNML